MAAQPRTKASQSRMTTGPEYYDLGSTISGVGRLAGWIRGPAGFPAHLAHRLRHPRRKRKVVPLQWQRVGSSEELLASRWPSIMRLQADRNPPDNSELLFSELATQEIIEEHYRSRPQATGIGLGCLPNVLVSGQSLVGRSWLLYRLTPLTPLYVDDYLSNNLPVGDRKITRKQKALVPDVAVLVTHWNSGVYGHWLLEGMPKLLLLRELAHQLPPLRIVLPRSLGTWVSAWIEQILPGASIQIYDDRTTYLDCRRLLIPTLLSDPQHHLFHPELGRLLETAHPSVRPNTPRKRLYVSRVAPSLFRNLANQNEIESIATSEGLELVKPETLSIPEQINLFASAELIVGEFGSAMHNALFSPPGTTVLCLNWINGLQSRIAQLKRQRVGYLLPSNSAPVQYVEGAPAQTYHINPQRFRDCLKALLAR
jgi:capsular polysaccharide biosynthesis protein